MKRLVALLALAIGVGAAVPATSATIIRTCRGRNIALGHSFQICIDVVTDDPVPGDPGMDVMIDIMLTYCVGFPTSGNCWTEWIWENVGVEINDEDLIPTVTPIPGGAEITLFPDGGDTIILYFDMTANPIDVPPICISTATGFC